MLLFHSSVLSSFGSKELSPPGFTHLLAPSLHFPVNNNMAQTGETSLKTNGLKMYI